ncbi:lipoprotein-anchoring transpeptidase ErfK/SrfK [Mesorhizobium soli]|uniref:L,D-transpeptidase family protein n=1 Tax=Pseudaminobacter soli (ex Li et al. 2025) TaxID=1295366 RepID=UPI002476689E|nr:L,D-transpeptidase [Mesorhizobium soli]MDH6235172.1 lipoprotein-anchoring transpeptidase ErfK/SrfK [Mesorhizobium soli]
MISRIGFLAAVAAGFWAYAAEAAAPDMRVVEAARISKRADAGVQLAQSGDVQVYFDGKGNRIIVDSYTGEIIAVQPPRGVIGSRNGQRAVRPQPRERNYDDYSYETDSQPRGRYRERYPDAPAYEDDNQDYSLGQDHFPPPPGAFPDEQSYPNYPQRPQVVRREPVTRAPLGDPDASQPDNSEQLTIIEAPSADDNAVTEPPTTFTAREDVASIQILMDRAGASPGVVDGKFGSNVDKALLAYREITGVSLKSTDTAEIKAQLAATGGDPFVNYTITPEDAAGPFVASVPSDYSQKAQLDHLSYTSVLQMLGARFHMDEGYLKALNPGANFNRPGTIIRVANTKRQAASKVASIIADKARKQVRAYDDAGKLVVAYPATIGSSDTPSPTGTHAVTRVALNPNYTYNPKLNFKQGNNDKILTIPPGPNGPVGTVWIALDKPTYGIHGTPDPSKIGKTESHGCVRLTNWDAEQLAKLVSPGVPVEFTE